MSSTLGKYTTNYNWDALSSNVLQETTRQNSYAGCANPYPNCTSGNITSQNTYVYGVGLISITDKNGSQRYVLSDGLGSVTRTVTASAEVSTYDYDVYGAPLSPKPTDSFLFAGQQYDAMARGTATGAGEGLYYLRARFYDPNLGTFLTRDPLQLQLSPSATGPGRMPAVMGPHPPSMMDEWAPRPGTPVAVTNPQTLNQYSYAENNPANKTDPSGHCSSGLWSFCGMFTITSSISYGGVSVPILLLAGVDRVNCTYLDCLQLYNNPQPNGGWVCDFGGVFVGQTTTCWLHPEYASCGADCSKFQHRRRNLHYLGRLR